MISIGHNHSHRPPCWAKGRCWLLTLLLATTTFACEQRPNVILHPTPPNMPPSDAARIIPDSMPTGLSPGSLVRWTEVRSRLEGAKVIYDLGVEATQGPELFGTVEDIAIDGTGRLFVLDGQAQDIRVFERDGTFAGALGGLGDGPQELRGASAIVVGPNADIFVFGTGRHIKTFRHTDTGYLFHDHRPLPIAGGTSCITQSGRIIVAGASTRSDRNTVLHEMPLNNSGSVRSFGIGYLDPSPFIRYMMANRGPIACTLHENVESVVHAFPNLNVLRMMSVMDGTVKWTAKVVDHRQIGLTGTSTMLNSTPGEEWDVIVTLLPYRESHIILQVRRFTMPSTTEGLEMPDSRFQTYLVDGATGHGGRIDIGSQIMAIDSERYVVVELTPYPRIEVRSLNQ